MTSQQKRKRTQESFGWGKTIGGLARPMLRGARRLAFKFTLTMAAYYLIPCRNWSPHPLEQPAADAALASLETTKIPAALKVRRQPIRRKLIASERQSQGGTFRNGLASVRARSDHVLVRLPLLILIAAPFSPRLSRHTGAVEV